MRCSTKELVVAIFTLFLLIVNGTAYGAKSDKSKADKADQSSSQSAAIVKKVSKEIQVLKKNVVALNKDLRVIEEALLFPSGTKYTVFLSLDSGQFFTLESVKLKIDKKLVTSHVYSNRQRSALSRGGVQKLHVTNLSEGKHSITAFFTGLGPDGRPYKRATTVDFDKGRGSQFVELAVSDDESIKEPVFTVKQW
ncbi:MAG: hypothetical protein KUG82_20365 [Pseudomonadales bacterium]|nr:hypothetical protein [Pseudomonadales bacterium]